MKILQIKAWNYKNCADEYTIDFIAKTKKTAEDKEYELQEIAPRLFVFNTLAIVGKNASGKTTAVELINICSDILTRFQVSSTENYVFKNTKCEIIFYENGSVYKYCTLLNSAQNNEHKSVEFVEEQLFKKKYAKSNIKHLFEFSETDRVYPSGTLPKNTSQVFFALQKESPSCTLYEWQDENSITLKVLLYLSKEINQDISFIHSILKIFDENIDNLVAIDNNIYELTYLGEKIQLTIEQLFDRLSIGTIKGISLYYWAIRALQDGSMLIVDEIENHFHKNLVDNLISLFKDKKVNKNNATLIFTTHYNELLDVFNRRDNIYICKSEGKLKIYNMALAYKNIRPELLKSKLFYSNVFGTAVNYEYLMSLKRELMQ